MTSRRKRAERARVWAQNWSTCRNCGEKGAHFAPPGLGSPGMFICQKPDQSTKEANR